MLRIYIYIYVLYYNYTSLGSSLEKAYEFNSIGGPPGWRDGILNE